MTKQAISLLFFLYLSISLFAQTDIEKLMEKGKQVIASFEGFPPTPFKAPDMDGEFHTLDDYQGQILILHFWELYCEPCRSQIPSLERITYDYRDQSVAVLSFVNDYGEDLEMYLKNNDIDLSVIPNSEEFGYEAYAGELGYPRVFIIDQYGIIRKLIRGGNPDNEMDLYDEIKPLLETYLKE